MSAAAVDQAFSDFWSSFALKAYPSGYAEEYTTKAVKPALPYITYDAPIGDFDDELITTGRVWTRSTTWQTVFAVFDAVSRLIPVGGSYDLHLPGGGIRLLRSNPFLDRLPPENDDRQNKAGVIRLIARYFVV